MSTPNYSTGVWMEFVDETGSALPQLRIFNVSTNLSGIYKCGFVFHSLNNSAVHLTSAALSLNVLSKSKFLVYVSVLNFIVVFNEL